VINDETGGMIDQPSARLRLAAELAVGLARRLWMTLHHDATDAGFCWHMFQSTFVEGCYALWELGVALAGTDRSDDQGMTWQQCVVYAKQYPGDERFDLNQQSLFKFFPAPETRAGVLAYCELPDALFERLLATYIDNACEYGPDGTQLCSHQGLFKSTVEFEREIAALVECGYAERCGGMVKWTDKIAPVMRSEHCWVDPRPQITLPHDVLERVNELLHDGNPIAAIAVVREETGASLLECRTYVDDLRRKLH
jgi:hypothetical protein